MEAQIFTGHRTGSAVFHWVTVSDFLSFFCRSKVTETQSALCKLGEEWLMCLPSLMKAMLQRHSSFVCRWSCFGTFTYSHGPEVGRGHEIAHRTLEFGRPVGEDETNDAKREGFLLHLFRVILLV